MKTARAPRSEVPAAAPATPPFVVETLGPAEQRLSFRVGDSWCRLTNLQLKSGVRLGVTACQYDPSFVFSAVQPPAELELVVSKGAVLLGQTGDGRALHFGGNTLQLSHTRAPLPLQLRPTDDERTETVSLALSAARLQELLGTAELPSAFRALRDGAAPHALVSQALPPRLFRVFDELLNADVKGPARALWHDAKSLELLALMTDELVEGARAQTERLSAWDLERLQLVRAALIANLEAPPTLTQLARTAGLSETRLKAGFQTLFGAPVFSYLRLVRMETARALLAKRQLNVTEVAQRVGYANPGKFAAAFRRQFGTSPSSVASGGRAMEMTTLPRL